MAHELGIDKFTSGICFTYETKEKLMVKFAKSGERFGEVVRRVCEDLVKDVKLPKNRQDAIRRQMKENYDKRMEKRRLEELKRQSSATDGKFRKS